jgi:sirohydrochlorin cobaltochelatase
MDNQSKSGLILFGHGSKDPGWRAPFDLIAEKAREQHPERFVEIAFLELMEPDLPSTIDRLSNDGCRNIQILPLFLAAGRHTRKDLPVMVEQAQKRWPQVSFVVSPVLAEIPEVRDAIVSLVGSVSPDSAR